MTRDGLSRLILCAPAALLCVASLPGQTALGRIAGQVVDRETGRPLSEVRVEIVGQSIVVTTDLDGRFRTPQVTAGAYVVRASLIGFQPARSDSVAVSDGQTTIVNLALGSVPISLTAITVEAAAAPRSSDAGLLAIQQAAPAVSDGISAQAIARSPDANAGDAVRRVTGITLFEGKFLVVRGLGERYSNALLNGAEMPNPVVEKKIAPLDLFPASLLDAVVAAKTATPDRPGDFAGGSVDLRTKDFPEGRVLEWTSSQSFNDGATFRQLPIAGLSGTDFLALDDGRRSGPAIPFVDPGPVGRQQVLQSFRNNVWNPAPHFVAPGLGLGLTFGDQWQRESSALGLVASLTYGAKTTYTPERLSNIYYFGYQGATNVEWGGIANLTYRLSAGHKLSWKNLYTRSADQTTTFGQGTEGVVFQRTYNVRYVERYLWQTQITGANQLGFLLHSTLEWQATYGRARIADPDNHGATYTTALEAGAGTDLRGDRLVRHLADRTESAQADWSFPLSFRRLADGLLKFGGYYRAKSRLYRAAEVHIVRDGLAAPATGLDGVIQQLSPEQAFAPENLSTYFTYFTSPNHNDPYGADDNLAAVYGMVDVPLFPGVRVVGGVRVEQWRLRLKPGLGDPEGDFPKLGVVIPRDHTDPLWSANITLGLSSKMNVRLAAYRTVARPDSREISPGQYTPIGGLGACTDVGNPDLDRSLITNGDVRWEVYPSSGQMIAVSGFYKSFDLPIIELRTASASSGATCTVANGRSAEVHGGELELRRSLAFLPGALRDIALGFNLTVVASAIHFRPDQGLQARRFVGQSPVVLNASLAYEPPGRRLNLTLLYNYFGDRIKNYSNVERGTGPRAPNPNLVEQGRGSLDAKARFAFSHRVRLSLSGTNLLRAPMIVAEDSGLRRLVDRYNPGLSVSAGFNYAF